MTALALCLSLSLEVVAGDPPPPNPRNPVDYVKWLNEEFGRGANPAAVELFTQAIKTYKQQGQPYDVTAVPVDKLTADQRLQKTREWIEHSAGALQTFVSASQQDKVFFVWKSDSQSLLEAEQPDLVNPRKMCQVLLARARNRAAEGDAAALEDVFAALRVARQIESQPGLNSYSFGLGIASMAYVELTRLIDKLGDKLDPAATLKLLATADPPPVNVRRALLGEKALFYDTLQRCCKDTNGDGKLDNVKLSEGEATALNPPVAPEEAVKLFSEVCETLAGLDQLRFPAAVEAGNSAHAKLRTLGELEQANRELWGIDRLRRFVEVRQNGVRIVLCLKIWQKANGKWPETLKEALAGQSPTLRWDTYSDADLIYKQVNGEPLLYSVGRNGKDDGGKAVEGAAMGEQGDVVIWPAH